MPPRLGMGQQAALRSMSEMRNVRPRLAAVHCRRRVEPPFSGWSEICWNENRGLHASLSTREGIMRYDILKSLGLDHLDASSPEFLKTLERMQREAWESLRSESELPPDAAKLAGEAGS